MKKKLGCILLVDDDKESNFFHQLFLEQLGCAEKVQIALNGEEALDIVKGCINKKSPCPDIIFLDLNMPKMNGWEFLEEFEKLAAEIRRDTVIFILTSSLNPDDRERAQRYKSVRGFYDKFRAKELFSKIITEHFPDTIL